MIFIIRNFGWSGGKFVFLLYLYLFYRPCYTGTPNTSPRPVPPAVFPPPSLSVYPRYVCTKYTIGTSVLSIPHIRLFSVYPRYVCTQYKIKRYAGGIHLLDILICRGNTPPSYGGRGGGYPSLICKGDTPWCAGGVHSLISWYAGGIPPPLPFIWGEGGGYTSLICGEIQVLDRRWIHPLDMWWKIHFFNMQKGGGGVYTSLICRVDKLAIVR